MPFSVWVDALDAYVASQDFAEHEALGRGARRRARRRCCRRCAAPTATAGRSPTSATGPTARSAGCCALIADEQPLVLVLDDLHWSDGASLELIAALVAARAGGAGAARARLPPRSGGRAAGRGAGRCRACSRLELGQLSEAEAGRAARRGGRARRRRDLQPRRRQPVLPRAARPRRRATRAWPRRSATAPARRGRARRRSPARSRRSSSRCRRVARACSTRPPWRASRSSPISPPRSPSCREAEGLEALDDLLALDLVRPTDVPRRFVFRHPLVRRAVYESTRGGWRLAAHARAADALAARGADAAERAHHVEQSASQGDEEAIEVLLEAGAATPPRAPRRPRRAGSRRRCACCPSADTERQVEVRVALASALRSVGELERCRATLLEAIELLPAGRRGGRVELTALCAAVEHWQGRHEDAHRRLERAWEELPDRSTRRGRGAADRAGRRRALRARLRAGPRRWGEGRSRPRAPSATAR